MTAAQEAYNRALEVGTGAEVILPNGETVGLFEQTGSWCTLLGKDDNPDDERYGVRGKGTVYYRKPGTESDRGVKFCTMAEANVTGRIVPWLHWVDGELLPVPTP